MPKCPKCNTEYPDDVTKCMQCDESLSSDLTKTDFLHSSSSSYSKKEDDYKDQRSSAIMFFGFSIMGLIYLGLNLSGILNLINGPFSYCVLGALFLGIFYLGVDSLKKSKESFKGIDSEKQLTMQIESFLKGNNDLSSLDEADWSLLSEEELFFKRTEKLKKMITEQFGNIDEAFLDSLVESYYDENY